MRKGFKYSFREDLEKKYAFHNGCMARIKDFKTMKTCEEKEFKDMASLKKYAEKKRGAWFVIHVFKNKSEMKKNAIAYCFVVENHEAKGIW